ncbi:MAG TPA: 2-amino-4-hydroxy-6-hydroxymethyldihydropteridine diphosphokinase [Candidatus Dormibacteraeota bacterium]|jgi:2-amino-4-hydroxy-6-hydroxymethyldihydropteridine diphosphokinase|nr:2-amino-4-hydroxy-6-hydroxymethyldihydropteridine diphosphokinase [Candidatus Dormibacteraeota bacterium]
MTRAYLGLGSNLGDREVNLGRAREELEAAGVPIRNQSPLVETEPFGVTDQPRFVNQIVEVTWAGLPRDLLALVKSIETKIGRRPSFRWGPRLIDIDILLLGGEVINESDLTIPHAGLLERRFVLDPLIELAPDLTDPRNGEPLSKVLARLKSNR